MPAVDVQCIVPRPLVQKAGDLVAEVKVTSVTNDTTSNASQRDRRHP